MFKDEYQKEISAIKPSRELIESTKSKVKAEMQSKRRRPFLRPLIAMATAAAVLALVLVGNLMLPTEQSGNSFMLVAYAAEQQEDGTIATQQRLDFNQLDTQSLMMGADGVFAADGTVLGAHIYKGIAFRVEGENIVSVTLSVNEGHFGAIRTDNYTYWHVERLGATHMASWQEIAADDAFIWGTYLDGVVGREWSGEPGRSGGIVTLNGEPLRFPNVTITAIVTFEDGEVQEKTIPLDMAFEW